MFAGLGLTFFLIFALIAIALLVLEILVVVQAYQAGRKGWWIYLIAIFVGPMGLVSVIYWFVYGRNNPVDRNGEPFL